MNKRFLTLNGLTIPNTIFILVNIAMIIIGLYLTKHFYEVSFPTGFGSESSGLCSGEGFFSCDKTTLSILGSFLSVPTSFFGVIIGVLGVFGAIFPSESFERTNKFIQFFNVTGCIILFLFSLIVLKGLCPMCSAYYVLSFISFFLLYKKSEALLFKPDLRFLILGAVLIILPGVFLNSYYAGKVATRESLNAQYIKQYENLNNLGDPQIPSPIMLHGSSKDFKNTPLRVVIFSDFQCPFCQVVSNQAHDLIKEFEEKISIQYMFYPLDASCNKNVKGRFHDSACMAAYLAACDAEKFPQVHDYIFENQKEINSDNLKKWEKRFKLSNCFERKDLEEIVVQTINAGDQYKVKSTPTIIINGKKIEGTIPTMHLKAILKSLL